MVVLLLQSRLAAALEEENYDEAAELDAQMTEVSKNCSLSLFISIFLLQQRHVLLRLRKRHMAEVVSLI